MKFTELDATEARTKTTRVDFTGFDMNIGNKTVSLDGQWIDVLPADSDEFYQAKIDGQRKAIKGEKQPENYLVATIIKDWSFDEPCNEENKLQAVKIWPRLLIDHIDRVASSAVNFTKAKPKSSESTRKSKRG